MSDFKKIIDYFKFNRRGEKADKQTDYFPILYINEDYNNAIETNITSILKTYSLSDNCKYIGDEIGENEFYFRKATASHYVYYIKENINVNPSYKRIPNYINDSWQILPQEEINQLTQIKEGTFHNRYFDKQNHIAFELQLSNVTLFPDEFLYHPSDIKASEGEYSFDYLDHEGYDYSIGDWALRSLSETSIESYRNYKYRQVDFFKKSKSAKVNLLPKLNTNLFGNYVVRYTFFEKGIKHNSFMSKRAVKLRFNYFGAFLEYLNQTIFYAFDNPSSFESTNRQLFLAEYMEIVYQLLQQAKGDDVLKVLYYVPIGFFEKINSKFLWKVLDATLKGSVTNEGTNKEDIVLRILDGLAKSMNNNEVFLNELLKKHGEKETRFSLLYDKLNGDNFKSFVSFIHSIWFQSSFRNPENSLYKNNESPFVVNYEAKKEATFFYSNMNISWVNANLLKYEPDTSWWDEIVTVLNPALGEVVKQFTETEKSFYYHPFQPIAINNFDKQQTGVELSSPLMPAFVLKAGEDKAFWDNVVTATEYTVDIVTTFSGVGNLAKFRHLAKVASKANKLKFVSRTGKVVANAKAGARGAIGVIEVSSGTVNSLLKITDLRDEPWAKELSEFLLILELCSLGADLGEFLLKRARTSASNALEYEDEIRKAAKKEGIEDVDGLFKELRIIANSADKIIYEPLRFNKLYSISAAVLDGALNISKNIFFYLKNLTKPNTETVFYKGVEIFTDSPAKVKLFLEDATKVLKAKGVNGVEEFFEATGSSLIKKRLHSQTGETFICDLIRKKEMNKYYYYEIENFQYGTKNWNRKNSLKSERFECFVTLANKPEVAETVGKNILYADLYVPKSLNDTFQSNKLDLTDISLGKTMLDDGYAVLKKDLGKDLDGIYGEWLNNPGYKDFGGESINLTKLKEAMKGKKITKENLEKAALETVTGKWATSKGFTKAKVVSDPEVYDELNENINLLTELEVIFVK